MKKHRDRETLVRLYHDEGLPTEEIGERLGVTGRTIRYAMDDLGIPRRDEREARLHASRKRPVPTEMNSDGYETWVHHYDYVRERVYVHRLLAVAEYGFDAVRDMDVHHLNEIKWDNRPENIELISRSKHARLHHTNN